MNIRKVAHLAGVSSATVSRVINRPDTVKEETRDRVLRVIQESNYTPNPAARNLSTSTSPNNIALFLPDVCNPFFTEVLKGVTLSADKLGYNIFLFATDESPEREHRFLQTVKAQMLKGVIMIPVSENDGATEAYLADLERNRIPVVLLDRTIGSQAFDGIFTDDENSARQAVEALIGAGHTRIATIAGPTRSASGQARLKGYEDALARHDLPVRPEYVAQGDFKFEQGYEAATALMTLPEPPTAIFSANNLSTLGALRCLYERGLTVGRDVSILGFDELDNWMRVSPMQTAMTNLSVVERPVMQMAVEAMTLLQQHIAEDEEEIHVRRRIVLSNRIVLRGSERLLAPEE